MTELNIYTDGAAKGNPGPAGIGVVILNKNEEVIEEAADYIGETTNNVAEYRALLKGLKLAQQQEATIVNLYADSQLVIKQLTGEYRVLSENLKSYYQQADQLLTEFTDYTLNHIPRQDNKAADRLANLAIDEHQQDKKESIKTEDLLEEIKEKALEFELPTELLPIYKELATDLTAAERSTFKQGVIYGLLLAEIEVELLDN
ncbi:ribonuclease HI family protein [Fuchsiella alkaliacetigena]|uniref:ribonuclease HI family protein n=1 Tax=Fuchsiella alkaliacetigena TaxID=957042 RepID=UPI002009F00F|nr:ribonuclease HI family protein [Fuchsiella alkaliacetigena]MCK8824489.1 ribonuclease HI family protein [Fuchsiella alkaliacetigena]